jgi:putative nucleotidyltransferase-like protein
MDTPLIGLLQAAAQGRADWPLTALEAAQVRWAVQTGLGPLLWHTTHAAPESTPSPCWPLVQGTHLAARLLTAEQFEAMEEILKACRGRVPPLTLLKGISISEQYYPTPQLRLMRDLDILVDEEALPTVEALLSTLGYRQQSSRPPTSYATHHHSMPFVHPRRGLWVEVHRGLFPPASSLGMDRLFSRETLQQQRQPSTFQGCEVFRLSPELQLVYIAAHWAMAFQPIGGLIALLDAIYLLQRTAETLEWERLLTWLEGSAATAPLYLLLTYLKAAHLVDLPPEVLPQLRTRQQALSPTTLALGHGLVDRYLVTGRPMGRILSDYRLEVLWQTLLLGPGAPRGKLLRVPWLWLMASHVGPESRLWRRLAARGSEPNGQARHRHYTLDNSRDLRC